MCVCRSRGPEHIPADPRAVARRREDAVEDRERGKFIEELSGRGD